MQIQTTGIEQYMPGGSQNMKVMVIGGPGVGKTRWSSYWPAPFYLNCESGLSAVADRKVPYVDIVSKGSKAQEPASEKMLNALRWLKAHPDADKYGTVIVDTLDAFQRKVKDEWLLANNASAFAGFEAWGYLDAKMQALMTRLLSLDKHVILLVHYKDKTVSEVDSGGNKVDRSVTQLQLQGDIKDTAFNDFDLVGWMSTFWKPGGEGEGKVEARGITFHSTPQRPFLKDRLNITPRWLEVEFKDSDYTNLFSRFIDRIDELEDGEVVGEVVEMPDEDSPSVGGAVGSLVGGALPPEDPRDLPLDQLKKPELLKLGKELGLELKGSMLKGELIDAVSQARQAESEQPADAAEASPEPEETPAATDSTPVQADPVDEPEEPEEAEEDEGEAEDPEELIKNELGGELVSEEPATDASDTDEAPEPEPKPAADDPLADKTCEVCSKELTEENRDWVRLAYIKYRKYLCNADYQEAKKAA
jgi:hypothetical protein